MGRGGGGRLGSRPPDGGAPGWKSTGGPERKQNMRKQFFSLIKKNEHYYLNNTLLPLH